MSENIHLVPVPESMLREVYALLARGTAATAEAAAGTRDVAVVVDERSWTGDDMARLAQMLKHKGGRAMISLIATNSLEQRATYYEDLQHAGAQASDKEWTFDHVRAQLSWFSKYCKKVKGVNAWPMTMTTDPTADKGRRYTYQLDPKLARAWLNSVAR